MFKRITNISHFGGIFAIDKVLNLKKVSKFFNSELGQRSSFAKYNYSEVLLSYFYTVFSGATAIEDINYLRPTLSKLKHLKIPSADTIIRVNKELSVPSSVIETQGTTNLINVNPKMNKLLVRSALFFDTIDPNSKELIYDFDNQFIETEKYDATYGYKKQRGYFPGVAMISNIPVYIEGRNGNCSVKTNQVQTHQRAIELLNSQAIYPKKARMDAGSYTKEITDYFHSQSIEFVIRANSCASFKEKASKCEQWQGFELNHQTMEASSFNHEFGSYSHRIVAYRTKSKTGQTDLFTSDDYHYFFLITNDFKSEPKDIILFYNQRGTTEKVFDIQNNDFNWNALPYSLLEQNTVFLITMAIAHIIYKYLLAFFSKYIKGLEINSRLKRFIFLLVAIPAKITRSARQQVIGLATDNIELINALNTS